ncbi:bifunctional nicotinamide-nucleotide adenylyltransferase/Nudix hydroxylase [Chitinimonas taiwanensis]|uniref:Bifunctional NMN adenylyltransferase/nudix hydrolase n=1 Tax=Chitinimonas taiwanensis DSM 18899 TaxID=1121279 RepID=A0A1K2HD04_9NEIS|nr:bifunctional nicotinamide-nucleotide adenylyltransferase/Nudix hydroxylase [Chitinimonas taiwanensis]SFZ74417.1 bifunctional NMN adenylyltransferase/nudix hydrolase [Chitinimonas taiwanensis DSM 18899]
MREFDYLIFIGRFQPFHNGHLWTLQHALERADKVVVLCGSARQARNPMHPFTVEDRERMMRLALPEDVQSRVFVVGISDRMYNDQQWLTEVQNLVDRVIAVDNSDVGSRQAQFRIGIVGPPRGARHADGGVAIGGAKRGNAEYLELFPQWQRVEAPELPDVHASRVRHAFFDPEREGDWPACAALLPPPVFAWLNAFRASETFANLQSEYLFLKRYRQSWAAAPYPPTFVTVDAVVIHSGHVLLVRRRSQPGKGLWALPGGFVHPDERIKDAVIRELREEARLRVPAPVLAGSMRANRVFDHPQRSLRGRTITHAFLIELAPTSEGLPKVRGDDDAERAKWVPLFEFNRMEEQLFEDHFYIVNWFLGQV